MRVPRPRTPARRRCRSGRPDTAASCRCSRSRLHMGMPSCRLGGVIWRSSIIGASRTWTSQLELATITRQQGECGGETTARARARNTDPLDVDAELVRVPDEQLQCEVAVVERAGYGLAPARSRATGRGCGTHRGDDAAVDPQVDTRDERGRRAHEELDRGRDVVGRAEPLCTPTSRPWRAWRRRTGRRARPHPSAWRSRPD